MQKIIKYSVMTISALCAGLSLNACDTETAQLTDFAHQSSDLAVNPAIVYGKLENGVRYAVLQNDTPSKTAALRMRISSGSLNETDDQRGLAHFLEHMAFNGSKNIPEGEMVKRLERHGLAFGADTNAHTSFDETVYKLDLPNVEPDLLDETLMIMRETADHLSLNQDAIDRERGVVQSEKRNRDSAAARSGLANLEFFSRGSRLMARLPIGADETLAKIGHQDFKSYYQAYYRPKNTFIVLVGDMNTDFMIEKIAEHFGDWQAEGEKGEEKAVGTAIVRGVDIGYFTDPEIETSIELTIMKPYEEKDDNVDNRRENFIDGLGQRILNRRFSSLARKTDAPFISASAGRSDLYETADFSSLYVSSRPEQWELGFAAAEQELRKAIQFGFTQAELDEQLANSKKGLQVRAQKADTLYTSSHASRILNGFANESVVTHPSTGIERYLRYEDDITVKDVWKRFVKQWSGLDEPMIFLQTSLILENPKDHIRAVYEKSKSMTVVPNKVVEKKEFAYTDFGPTGKVKSQRHLPDLDAHLIEFENNVLLNFKKTDFKKDAVNIAISVGDGRFSTPRKSLGLTSLANTMINFGGLKAHSADEITSLMAGKTVGVGFGVGNESFSFSGSTIPSDLEPQLNLMAAYLTAPGYREEARARFHKYIESWYPTLDATPNGVAQRDVGKLLRSGDVRFGIPPQTELLSAQIDEVKNWIKPHLDHGQIEITVIGDIDKELVIQQVARTFGALPTRKKGHKTYANMQNLKFPKGTRRPISLSHSGDANRALLKVYWPAPDGTDLMRNRRLSILRQIFANRLIDIIREEEAAAYSPGASRNASRQYKDYGYFGASLGLEPQNVPKMIKVLDKIAAEFAKGEFDQDEFDRAITPVLEGLDTSLESNSYWMSTLRHASTDDWGVKAFKSRKQAFQNMTLAELKPLAAKIFRPELAYRVQILPHE